MVKKNKFLTSFMLMLLALVLTLPNIGLQASESVVYLGLGNERTGILVNDSTGIVVEESENETIIYHDASITEVNVRVDLTEEELEVLDGVGFEFAPGDILEFPVLEDNYPLSIVDGKDYVWFHKKKDGSVELSEKVIRFKSLTRDIETSIIATEVDGKQLVSDTLKFHINYLKDVDDMSYLRGASLLIDGVEFLSLGIDSDGEFITNPISSELQDVELDVSELSEGNHKAEWVFKLWGSEEIRTEHLFEVNRTEPVFTVDLDGNVLLQRDTFQIVDTGSKLNVVFGDEVDVDIESLTYAVDGVDKGAVILDEDTGTYSVEVDTEGIYSFKAVSIMGVSYELDYGYELRFNGSDFSTDFTIKGLTDFNGDNYFKGVGNLDSVLKIDTNSIVTKVRVYGAGGEVLLEEGPLVGSEVYNITLGKNLATSLTPYEFKWEVSLLDGTEHSGSEFVYINNSKSDILIGSKALNIPSGVYATEKVVIPVYVGGTLPFIEENFIKDTNGVLVDEYLENDFKVYEYEFTVDGSSHLNLDYTDLYGDTFERNFSFILDQEAPVVGAMALSGGSYSDDNSLYLATGNVSVTVSVEDNIELSKLSLYDETKLIDEKVFADGLNTGSHTFTVTKSGNYKVLVEDKAGLKSEKPLDSAIVILESGLSSTIRGEFSNTNNFIKGNLGLFDVVISGSSPLSKVVVTVGDEVLLDKSVPLDVTNFAHTFEVDGSTITTEGSNTIKVVATDFYGKTFTTTKVVIIDNDGPDTSYKFDRKAPLIVDGSYVVDVSQGVTIKANDPAGVSKIEVKFNGSALLVSPDSEVSFDVDKTGTYTFVAYDNVGNVSETKEIKTYIIDSVSEVTFDTSGFVNGVGGIWKKDNLGSINFKVNNRTGLKSISATINNVDQPISFTGSLAGVDKSFTLNGHSLLDGTYTVKVVTENYLGVKETFTQVYKVDTVAPVLSNFEFIGDGYIEGGIAEDSTTYGYFFKDTATLVLQGDDIGVGLKGYTVWLDGIGYHEEFNHNTFGEYRVDIPENFKGVVKLQLEDALGNKSNVIEFEKVVTETVSKFNETSDLTIELPSTPNRTLNGIPLYNADVLNGLKIKSTFTGIRRIDYGLNDTTVASHMVGINGVVSGAQGTDIVKDGNLVTGINYSPVFKTESNSNKVWLSFVDRAGYEHIVDRTFALDVTAPKLSYAYEDGKALDAGYVNYNRVGVLTIDELNFNSKDVVINTTGTLLGWTTEGTVHKARILFDKDGTHEFSASYKDLAGNQGNSIVTSSFILDKVAPVVTVTSGDNISNGKYTNNERSFIVKVIDSSFDPSLIKVSSGNVGTWSSVGNVHTATVSFINEGVHTFTVNGFDKAGNAFATITVPEFVIDFTNPTIGVDGVVNGQVFYDDFRIVISTLDENIDAASSTVTLKNIKTGDFVNLSGDIGATQVLNGLEHIKTNDGVYEISIVLYDLAGNTISENLRFFVNRFGSDFEFNDADYNGKYVQELADDVIIKESSIVRITSHEARVTRNGKLVLDIENFLNVAETQLSDGTWSYVYTIDKSMFTEGAYEVEIVTTDVEGKVSDSRSTSISFIVDQTAPVIIMTYGDKKVYNEASKVVWVEVTDNFALDNFVVTLNDKEVEPVEENGRYKLTLQGREELQTLKVVAEDKAGNESEKEESAYVSTNAWLNFRHSNTFIYLAGVIGLLVVGLFLLLFKRNRKTNKELEARSRELEASSGEYRRQNSTERNSTANGSGGSLDDTEEMVE